MNKKVILVSIDGMRPDGVLQCGNPYVETLKKEWAYTFNARTVFPSVTLPCHTSLFHSVPPTRHGTTTNTYMPQVHPIEGLFELLKHNKKVNAMFYGWEELRDVSRPGSLKHAVYLNAMAHDGVDARLTDYALDYIKEKSPDFVFLYLVDTDERGGHGYGWMTPEYLNCISIALDCVKKVAEACPEYDIIVTADHGGHDRAHGSDQPEDMTIPQFYRCAGLEKGTDLGEISILDIAPTVADLFGLDPVDEWEGKSVLKK